MTFEEKALSIIEEWASGTYYGGTAQKKATLQSLIAEALEEATLAERERAAAIVLAECTPDCNCPECANLKAIATTIRKGEGV